MRQVELIIPVQTAATVQSTAMPAQNMFAATAQIVATGSAAGTLILQASNDNLDGSGQTTQPTNWAAIPSATVSVSGAGVYLVPYTQTCYQYIRAVYTNTGTGTIAIIIKAQTV